MMRKVRFYEITPDEIKDAMRSDWPFDEKKPIFIVTLDNDTEFYTIAPKTVKKKILSHSKGNLFCVVLVDEEKGRFKNYVVNIYEDSYIDIDFTDDVESQDD